MHELIGLLDNILGPHQKHAHGEFYWSCPFCHHHKPKLAINVAKGAWHCWVCNVSGRHLRTLFTKVGASRQDMAELARILNETGPIPVTAPVYDVLALPREYQPLWIPQNKIEYRNALRYITDRGVTVGDIIRYQIGYCDEGPYANRIIIPSFDATGRLNYFVGRMYYDTDAMKYKNPHVSNNVIGFEQHINWQYPVVLCEGVMDAIAIKRNAIPLLGKMLPPKLLHRLVTEQVQTVYLSLDTDALQQTARIAEELRKNIPNIHIVQLDGKDPSDIGFTKMCELIQTAAPLGFADLIKLRAIA